jgi:peptidoglycan/LPS O-acetylase OafA/YrhL
LATSPIELIGSIGLALFFFVSSFSLCLHNKTVRNRQAALLFYKKRAVRIYPMYWLFVAGILIVYKLSFAETLIYIAGLQALFFPLFISVLIYHFVTVILVFYLLFPLIIFFDDYGKLLLVSLVPLLFFVAIKLLFGLSDPMFLGYYGLFVGGIIAGKSDVYNKLRQAKFKNYFVLTIPLFVALSILWLNAARYVNSFVLGAFLTNLFGISIALILFFWAICYVKVFNTKLYTFFTFVAFSTFGVFFINMPFFVRMGKTLNFTFGITGTATFLILALFIPFLVVAGYFLQFIINQLINVPKLRQKH